MDVTLAWPVCRAAIVDHVGHVVGHVISASALARCNHLALFHAQHASDAVHSDLQRQTDVVHVQKSGVIIWRRT